MSEAVPEVWAKSKIGSLISEISQKTTSTNQYEVLSVTKDGIQSQREYFKKQIASEDNTGYKVVHKGNLVFGTMNLWMGSLDVLKKTDIGIVSPAYKTFKFNSEKCGIDFMSYYMRSPFMIQKYIMHSQQGASIVRRNLDLDQLLEDVVSIPPLPEQKKIAAILTSVDEVIDATQKQIDKLQDLKKATMNELLTKGIGHTEFKDSELGMIPKSWEVRALGEILDLKNGVNTDKDAFGSGSPFITYMDVHSGNDLDETVLRKFVKLSAKENEAFSVKFGDVFFTRTSETPEEIGLSNTYLGRDVGAVFNGFCIRGRPKSKLLSAKLSKYLFRSEYIRTQMKLLCKYTTRAGISGESLNRCLIALPPMNEQFISENTIISFDKDLRLKEIKLAQTQSLKKSLMQDLLTGKVRVKVD